MDYFRCGKILTTHGIKGDVKVQVFSDFNRFEKGKRIFIKHQDEYVPVVVQSASDFGKYLLVHFNGLDDCNAVKKYHLDDLFILAEDRKEELSEDEFYYSDLIGLPVYSQDGITRGIVKEVKELPQCDYLYIHYNNKNYYVPFLNEFILEVSDKIVVKELEGLFYEN